MYCRLRFGTSPTSSRRATRIGNSFTPHSGIPRRQVLGEFVRRCSALVSTTQFRAERSPQRCGIPCFSDSSPMRSLYKPSWLSRCTRPNTFGIPIVLESNAGWRLERLRWSEPMVNIVDDHDGDSIEIPRTDYTVDEKEQPKFAAFLAFFDDAIQGTRNWKIFRLAARRYLRAIQIAGAHPLNGDDHEDALLQYVFALEALLSGGDRDAIGDKLATRAAWLIGTSDTIRYSVYKSVKKLYRRRSAIVHGSSDHSGSTPSHLLDEVRDLIRRMFIGLMALRCSSTSSEECLRLLRTAAVDQRSQAVIANATQPVWSLIDPGMSWPGPTWGPKYLGSE